MEEGQETPVKKETEHPGKDVLIKRLRFRRSFYDTHGAPFCLADDKGREIRQDVGPAKAGGLTRLEYEMTELPEKVEDADAALRFVEGRELGEGEWKRALYGLTRLLKDVSMFDEQIADIRQRHENRPDRGWVGEFPLDNSEMVNYLQSEIARLQEDHDSMREKAIFKTYVLKREWKELSRYLPW